MTGDPDFISWLPLIPALLAFMLPGWQLARLLALPLPAISAFLLSACGWFGLVLGTQTLGLPLTRPLLLGTWLFAGLAVSLWLWRKRPSPPAAPAAHAAPPVRPGRADLPWLIPVGIAFVSLGVRSFLDPLNGWDTAFRWDYLARAMLDLGRLDFYPPLTAADYEIYAWPDGMPPLASFLNFWIYLACGSHAPTLLAGRLIGESALAFAAVFHLARALNGPRAGWPALAVFAASPLVLWNLGMGQETGLTTIGVAAMLYFIREHHREADWRPAFGAGLAATIAAISRDYTVALALLGAGLVVRPAVHRWRSLAAFACPLLLIAAPWYVRNWILTGNPVFPQSVGGLFPGNPVLDELLVNVRRYWAFTAPGANLSGLVLTLFVLTVSLLPGVAGLFRARSRGQALPLVLTFLLVAGLWAWSAQMTAGGWNYSLRVLGPACAILAACAGWLADCPRRTRHAVLAALVLLAADAAHRSWYLPASPRSSPWVYDFSLWRTNHGFAQELRESRLWPALTQKAAGEVVLVDTTGAHTQITSSGGRATMVFSPAASPCFAPGMDLARGVAALRANHIRLVVLSTGDPVAKKMLDAHPFLRLLVALPPTYGFAGMSIYDLTRLAAQPTP